MQPYLAIGQLSVGAAIGDGKWMFVSICGPVGTSAETG